MREIYYKAKEVFKYLDKMGNLYGYNSINYELQLKDITECLDIIKEPVTEEEAERNLDGDEIRRYIFDLVLPYWMQTKWDMVGNILHEMNGKLSVMSTGKWNKTIWYGCLNLKPDRTWAATLLDYFLDYGGYRIKSDGNPVRDAVYSNRMDLATYLLEKGFPRVKTVTMFQINNMINWDPERLKFLLENGTEMEMTDKERKCLDILQAYRAAHEENIEMV